MLGHWMKSSLSEVWVLMLLMLFFCRESLRHCLRKWLSATKLNSLCKRWCVSIHNSENQNFRESWTIVSETRMKPYEGFFISRGWHVGSSVTQWLRWEPFLKSSDLQLKLGSDNQLDLFHVLHDSTPQLCLYIAKWSSFRLLGLFICLFMLFVSLRV